MEKYGPKIWMDGKFVPTNEAKVSVMSHAIQYASSVFEGIKSYYISDDKQIIFRLDEHVDRLYHSAELYGLEIPYAKEILRQAIIDLVNLNRGKDLYIRPCFFLGTGYDTIEITENIKKHLIIAVWELPRSTSNPFTLTFSSFIRPSDNVLLTESKCAANYMNSILIRQEAHHKGFNDAIALNEKGFLAEISTANIFFIKDGILHTPSKESSILNGITRQTVISLAQHYDYPLKEGNFSKEEIREADAIFLTGTASEIKLVTKLENRELPSHPLFKELRTKFWEIINLENEEFQEWITHV